MSTQWYAVAKGAGTGLGPYVIRARRWASHVLVDFADAPTLMTWGRAQYFARLAREDNWVVRIEAWQRMEKP